MSKEKTRTIQVKHLARVEGEGGLYVKMTGDQIESVKLNIFEPPRFFEAFLRGRSFRDAPDITARICGICPVAYQMSACHALEMALGVKVDGQLRALRRLLYCGEWIQSHVLHAAMLHTPDFLGYPGAVEMAKDHPDVVKRALSLKKVGNELMTFVGGRDIHPINIKVGGFYSLPLEEERPKILEKLKQVTDIAEELARLFATFSFPDITREYDYVSLIHEDEYPMNEGDIISSTGSRVPVEKFLDHYREIHVEHSNALHAEKVGGGEYLVGPMARFHHNFELLTPRVKELAKELGTTPPCFNPFMSITVRALETLYACEEAIRILEQYDAPDRPDVDLQPQAGTGHGCTEAPRGILYHRYKIDDEGLIQDAVITPPTAQNQPSIESDVRAVVEKFMDGPEDVLTHHCEQAIRNYDPCISCATHFLKVRVDRT